MKWRAGTALVAMLGALAGAAMAQDGAGSALRPEARGLPATVPVLAMRPLSRPEALGHVPFAGPRPAARPGASLPAVPMDSGRFLVAAVLPPVLSLPFADAEARSALSGAAPANPQSADLQPDDRGPVDPGPLAMDRADLQDLSDLSLAVAPSGESADAGLMAAPMTDSGARLTSAELPPPLDARISARNYPPVAERLANVEEMLDRLMGPVAEPDQARVPTASWTGPVPMLRPAAFVPGQPQIARLGGLRPSLRSESFETRIAIQTAPMVYIADLRPGDRTEISPYAIGNAVRPPMRTEAFEVMAASAPAPRPPAAASTPAAPLAMGSGLCGVAILSGNVLGNVSGAGACGVENAVEVTAVGGIRLSTGLTIDCTTATAFADWVQRVAHPAVGGTGGGLARIEVGGGYTCRGRNGQANARLSEHAFGRAIDIMGFTLQDGSRLTVLSNWGNSILRQMHRGACGIFGTVLGPDANRFHRDHFHFDTARYRSGSYCR